MCLFSNDCSKARRIPFSESVNEIYTLTYGEQLGNAKEKSTGQSNRYKVEVSLLNVIPVKSSLVTVSKREYVEVSGELFGLRLFTQGVMIVGIDEVDTETGYVSPAKSAGLQKGDIIYSINGVPVTMSQQVSKIFASAADKTMEIGFIRADRRYTVSFTLAYSVSEGKYKAGM